MSRKLAMSYRNRFIIQAKSLRNKASQTRQLAQLGKASGLTTIAVGAAGLLGSAAAAVPLAVGAVTYAACMVCESSRTKRFMPLPWNNWDALRSANSHAGISTGYPELGLQAHHYLSQEDKARFYLTNYQGHMLTALAEQVGPQEFNHITINMVDTLIGVAGRWLNYPELMSEAAGTDLLEIAASAIPDAAPAIPKRRPKKMPKSVRTIPAKVEPVSTPNADQFEEDPWLEPLEPVAATKAFSRRASAQELIIARPYVSRAFYGAQRSGKTWLAAVCSAELAASDLKTKTFYINLCHAEADSLDIWSHAKKVIADLSVCDAYTAEDAIEDSLELIDEAMKSPHSLLIVDEFIYTASTTNQYAEQMKPLVTKLADKITTLSSAGTKRKQAIYTIAPNIVASRLSNDGKAVKSLEPTLVGIAPGYSIDVDGHAVIWSDEVFTQVYDNYKGVQHPGDKDYLSERIAWVNNKWRPVS